MDLMPQVHCGFNMRTNGRFRLKIFPYMYRKLLLYLIYLMSFVIVVSAGPLSRELPKNDNLSSSSSSSSPTYIKKNVLKEFRVHDVTVPVIYIPSNEDQLQPTVLPASSVGYHEKIYLTFSAFKIDFKLDLQLNSQLFGSDYTEKTVHSGGETLLSEENSAPSQRSKDHCYYIGHVVGLEKSSSAGISTCNGIRGYITVEDEGYHIEPVERSHSITGQHYVLRDSDYISQNLSCGQTSTGGDGSLWKNSEAAHKIKKRGSRLRWPYDANDKTMLVELYIANDFSQYNSLQRDTSEVIRRTKDIVNIVSSLYRPLNMYVALVGVEVWMDGDKIEIVDNADKTMNNFLDYRRHYISPKHRNDNAQLITGRTLGDGVVGKAPIMTICTWQYSGGVNLDHSSLVGPVATTVAHELGHNFGLTHDVESCACPQDRCIMAPSSGGQNSPTRWSECSLQQFSDGFHQGMDYCLHNLPDMIYGGAVCGNGFTEPGEQCDCGLPQDCTNPCCNASTCKLVPNASCSMGECCDTKTCQPKPMTTPCRPVKGSCDLSEHCNGVDEYCPDDVHIQDGTKCLDPYNVASYCFQGKCQTAESQCRLLWGKTGHTSHKLCYEHFNIMGTANGHCGFNWVEGKTFKKCESRDTMCGMLHCTHRNEKLMFWKEALAYTLPEAMVMVNNTREDCKGVILDVGLDMPDPGMVPNGAKCGESKMCINRQCLDIDSLGIKHCPDCNGHGVCNSLAQCHCDPGYAPPNCDRPGNGGSLQSGPVAPFRTNVGLVVGLCFLFLFLLPFLCIIGFCSYRHRDKLKRAWLFQQADKYRSVYRATPRNDAERPASIFRPPAPPPITPITVKSSSPRRARPKSVMVPSGSVRAPPPPPAVAGNQIRRAQSFRPQDISDPLLKSCTNQVVCQTVGVPKPSADPLPTLTPSRHAPAPPPPPGSSRGDIDTPRRIPKRPPQPHLARYSNQMDTPAQPFSMSGTLPESNLSSETSTLAGSNAYEPMENVYEEIIPQSPDIKPPEPPDARHRFYSSTPRATIAAPAVTTSAAAGTASTAAAVAGGGKIKPVSSTTVGVNSKNGATVKSDEGNRLGAGKLDLGRSKSPSDASLLKGDKGRTDDTKPNIPGKPLNNQSARGDFLASSNNSALSNAASQNSNSKGLNAASSSVVPGEDNKSAINGKTSDKPNSVNEFKGVKPSTGRATSPAAKSSLSPSPSGDKTSLSPTRPAPKTPVSPSSAKSIVSSNSAKSPQSSTQAKAQPAVKLSGQLPAATSANQTDNKAKSTTDTSKNSQAASASKINSDIKSKPSVNKPSVVSTAGKKLTTATTGNVASSGAAATANSTAKPAANSSTKAPAASQSAVPTRPAPTQPPVVRPTLTSKARAQRQAGNESQC